MITVPRRTSLRDRVAHQYRRHVRGHLSEMQQQRLKLIWHVWGYRILFKAGQLSAAEKTRLIRSCLLVDWHVPHAHKPLEISHVIVAMASQRPGDVVIEAGCWKGGSTAKLSTACALLGLRLHVYDSFQGVETGPSRFSGAYAAELSEVQANVARWGELAACELHAGWFRDTCRPGCMPGEVKVVYIDCDLATGTREVLQGVLPSLSPGAQLFSQDYHIPEVQEFLEERISWSDMGVTPPALRYVGENTVQFELG